MFNNHRHGRNCSCRNPLKASVKPYEPVDKTMMMSFRSHSTHPYNESPMFRHRITAEERAHAYAEWEHKMRRQNWRDRDLAAKYPARRILPALNP